MVDDLLTLDWSAVSNHLKSMSKPFTAYRFKPNLPDMNRLIRSDQCELIALNDEHQYIHFLKPPMAHWDKRDIEAITSLLCDGTTWIIGSLDMEDPPISIPTYISNNYFKVLEILQEAGMIKAFCKEFGYILWHQGMPGE